MTTAQRLLDQAESLRYPRLLIGLHTIDPTREGWYAFVSHASDRMLEQAISRLQRRTTTPERLPKGGK